MNRKLERINKMRICISKHKMTIFIIMQKLDFNYSVQLTDFYSLFMNTRVREREFLSIMLLYSMFYKNSDYTDGMAKALLFQRLPAIAQVIELSTVSATQRQTVNRRTCHCHVHVASILFLCSAGPFK